ncbi:MAG: FecR domain-containing protein [Burkholderiales bacterium]|nr:FecR domain-containing protein [Opitutaceae bacterium]
MKNILRSFLGGIAAVVLAVVAQAADLAPGALSAGTIKGDVSYKLAGTTQYLPLVAGTAIPQGATIKTGAGSIAVIVFASGSTASIRPDSEVEITKFEQEAFTGPLPSGSEPSVSNTQIKIVNGQVVSKVSKLKKGSEFVVSSPVGAAGVRGTTFSVIYNAATGAFTIAVIEGGVVVRTVTGQTASVAAYEQVTASQNGNISAITKLSNEAARDILATIQQLKKDIRDDLQGPDNKTDIDTSIIVSPN